MKQAAVEAIDALYEYAKVWWVSVSSNYRDILIVNRVTEFCSMQARITVDMSMENSLDDLVEGIRFSH